MWLARQVGKQVVWFYLMEMLNEKYLLIMDDKKAGDLLRLMDSGHTKGNFCGVSEVEIGPCTISNATIWKHFINRISCVSDAYFARAIDTNHLFIKFSNHFTKSQMGNDTVLVISNADQMRKMNISSFVAFSLINVNYIFIESVYMERFSSCIATNVYG